MVRLTLAQIREIKIKRELLRKKRNIKEKLINQDLARRRLPKQYKIFVKQPKKNPPIFSRTTAQEIGQRFNADQTDFLQAKENFMFSDDFIPKEQFVARRIRDL